MEQKLDSGTKRYDSGTNEGTEHKGKRLDLSVPQVAASAVAAIAAAVLASQLDVYGTIIGAGVVSVIATCGGSIFHYLFRRTGEHLRDAAEQARPKARQVPVRDGAPAPAAGQGLPDTLDVLGADYGEATTHRSRRRGWKRPVLGAVVVFLVAMICITGYELAAGHDLTGNARTTIGSVVGGGDGSATRHSPSPGPSTSHPDGGRSDGSGGKGGSADPSTSPGTGDGQDQRQGQEKGNGQGSGTSGEHTGSGAPTQAPSTPSDGSGQTPSAPTPTPSAPAGTGASGGGQDGSGTDGADGSTAG